MNDTLHLFSKSIFSFFQSRTALQLEILALRHQVQVLQRKKAKRLKLNEFDRLIWVFLSTFWSQWRNSLVIVKPNTVIQWHRKGFKRYWRWKSRTKKMGRNPIPKDVQELIRKMSRENPLWGAPRIHGELLKLGHEISEQSVSKYMVKFNKPPSQPWKTFLDNHVGSLASMDFFTVPSVFFKVFHVLIILNHERRYIVHCNVTTNPTAAWVARQIKEAFPWDSAPKYLIHDRDPVFLEECRATLIAMGINLVLTAPRSPWQNSFVERVIGSIRHEALDHIIVLNEEHLRQTLFAYITYYHNARTHLALDKDCPNPRAVQQQDSAGSSPYPISAGYITNIAARPPKSKLVLNFQRAIGTREGWVPHTQVLEFWSLPDHESVPLS